MPDLYYATRPTTKWTKSAGGIEINGLSNWSTCSSKWRRTADIRSPAAALRLLPLADGHGRDGWWGGRLRQPGDVWYVTPSSQARLMRTVLHGDERRPAVTDEASHFFDKYVCLNHTFTGFITTWRWTAAPHVHIRQGGAVLWGRMNLTCHVSAAHKHNMMHFSISLGANVAPVISYCSTESVLSLLLKGFLLELWLDKFT